MMCGEDRGKRMLTKGEGLIANSEEAQAQDMRREPQKGENEDDERRQSAGGEPAAGERGAPRRGNSRQDQAQAFQHTVMLHRGFGEVHEADEYGPAGRIPSGRHWRSEASTDPSNKDNGIALKISFR